jgi:hypothetical protein
MNIPRVLRDQLKFYEGKGFHVTSIEPRNGAHFLVVFAEFPQAQIISKNGSDPRAWHNNVAQYRRLQREHTEGKTNG